MTLRAINIAANNFENPVEADRTLFDTLAKRVAGVIFEASSVTQSAAPELKVVPGTGHTALVQPGKSVIREKSNPQWRGGYWFTNDVDEVVNLPVPQSNPFIATVVARVADPQYGAVTGTVGPRIDVISGTPATSPVAVSDATIDAVTGTPGGWERLSDVRINTADTGAIPAGQFTDKRTPGGFGRINCWSTNRPVVANSGIEIFEMDTGKVLTYYTPPVGGAVAGWYLPWNGAWGTLGRILSAANVNHLGEAVDAPMVTLNLTVPAPGRFYEARAQSFHYTGANGGNTIVRITAGGTVLASKTRRAGSGYHDIQDMVILAHDTPAAGARSYVYLVRGVAGYAEGVIAGQAILMVVEDVGPAVIV